MYKDFVSLPKNLNIFFCNLPKILIPSPGPGNGCLLTKSSGTLSSLPNLRTSSLNNSLNGSKSLNFKFLGSPPTLWCDLIVTDFFPYLTMIQSHQDKEFLVLKI